MQPRASGKGEGIYFVGNTHHTSEIWESPLIPGGSGKEKIKLNDGKKKEILKIVWNESKIEKQLEKFTKFNFVNDENLWEN